MTDTGQIRARDCRRTQAWWSSRASPPGRVHLPRPLRARPRGRRPPADADLPGSVERPADGPAAGPDSGGPGCGTAGLPGRPSGCSACGGSGRACYGGGRGRPGAGGRPGRGGGPEAVSARRRRPPPSLPFRSSRRSSSLTGSSLRTRHSRRSPHRARRPGFPPRRTARTSRGAATRAPSTSTAYGSRPRLPPRADRRSGRRPRADRRSGRRPRRLPPRPAARCTGVRFRPRLRRTAAVRRAAAWSARWPTGVPPEPSGPHLPPATRARR